MSEISFQHFSRLLLFFFLLPQTFFFLEKKRTGQNTVVERNDKPGAKLSNGPSGEMLS